MPAAPAAPFSLRALLVAGVSLGVAAVSVALSFRLGLGDLDVSLRANAGRGLLAAAAGAALAVSGALASAAGTRRLRESALFAASTGAAAGAALALVVWEAPALAVVMGAIGAGLFAVAVLGAARLGRWSPLFVGMLLLVLLGTAVVSAGVGSTLRAGHGGAVLWLLGDPSRGTPLGGTVLVLASVGLTLAALPAVRGLATEDLCSPGRDAVRPAGARSATLSIVLLALGVGAVGPIAFLGLFAPLLVRGLVGPQAAAGPALLLTAGVGAAALMAADALPRALVGGYAFPLNVSIGVVAIPAYWLWLRSSAAAPASAGGPRLQRIAELALWVVATASLVAGVAIFTRVVRSLA